LQLFLNNKKNHFVLVLYNPGIERAHAYLMQRTDFQMYDSQPNTKAYATSVMGE
jgi:hypothetical protein